MAAEIRDLEDQLYEYDNEYRILERELATLRAQNAVNSGSTTPSVPPSSKSFAPLEFLTPETPSEVPSPAESVPAEEVPSANSILEGNGTAPDSGPAMGGYPSESPNPPAPDRTNPFDSRRNERPNNDGFDNSTPGSNGFDSEGLLPPQIEIGEPTPPPLPTSATRVENNSQPTNSLELNLSRIEVPVQLASQKKNLGSNEPDDNIGNGSGPAAGLELEPGFATIKPAVEQVRDQRIVELAFHPTLSRAANFDDVTDDDGLYLVLQPKNAAGRVVPISADLSVVVLDPSREGREARIGRRDYSAEEVRAKMIQEGTRQGIHLTMPWNGPDPGADRVIVFVRYTFRDGRQVIGEKTFFVSGAGGLKTVWAPRGDRSHTIPNETPEVLPASHEEQSLSRVVRPAVGTRVGRSASGAPNPQRR
ncbi:MAG: hypothetical protein AAGG44_10425 [Planctomycetota bacterium]